MKRSSNLEKASLLSQSKLDNYAISVLEEVNLRSAAEIRKQIEAEISKRARSIKPEDIKWRIYKSKITRGKIPTEAYVELRMTEFGYKRIFDLAKKEYLNV